MLALCSLAVPALAQQKALTDCQNIVDRTARFACYDQAEAPKAIIPKGATQSTIPARIPSPAEAASVAPAAASSAAASSSAKVSTVPAEAAKKPFYSRLWPFGKDDDKPAAKTEVAKAPAKTGSDVDNFGRSASATVATDGAGVKELTDTIASIKQVRPNSLKITLASGQVWRQSEDKLYLLQAGEKISIRPSGWGSSYRLYSERLGSYIQVDRVDQ